MPTRPSASYFIGEVLDGGRALALILCISETKFVGSTFICFIRRAQFGLPKTFVSVRMCVLRHS